MRKRSTKLAMTILITLSLAVAPAVLAQTLDEAARQAARQYNAKVLSARTVQEGNKSVHVIRLLTKDGVVKTVRVTVKKR
jgi:cell division protein YceG involved in septum cleavage